MRTDALSSNGWWLLLIAVSLPGLCGCRMMAMGQNTEGARLFQQGQYDAALTHFQQAVANDPKSADAYYNMARTLHQLGNARKDEKLLGQAETLYNQCLDYDENHVDCYRGLAVLLVETGRVDRGFALLKNWVVRNPESADARVELARLYQEFGDKETATIQLQQAVQMDQQNRRAWNALGYLREDSGDYSQALANYQRSYSLNRFQPSVAQRIAALNGAVGTGISPSGRSDTRMVESPQWLPRY
jgi:tetratricopeptide (TPR) repeat protein